MKNQYLRLSLFVLVILVSACGNKEKVQVQEDLIGLEQAYEKDKKSADKLLAKLKEYTIMFPDDMEANARYTFRAGEIYVTQNDLNEAIEVLQEGIDKYKQEDATPKSLKLLGDIYTKMDKLTDAMTSYSRLTREYPKHPATKEAATAIPDKNALAQRITNLEKMTVDSSQSAIRNSIVRELARAYHQYAIVNPEAEDATKKLLKASYSYGTVGDFINSTTVSKTIIELHPKTDYAKDAMFHIANLYPTMAQMDQGKKEVYHNEAKKYYEMLIAAFPNDPLAEQAKLLMNNIGKSDEELLEEILNKKKKK